MWQNWSGLERTVPDEVLVPTGPDDVVEVVRRAAARRTTVKMVGSGHSFTGISVPHGWCLRPEGMQGIVAVDREAMTVTAWAGTRLHALNTELEALGLSLHNMGDIAEQTLAGAVSTGTHGTGGVAAGLASQLAGFELVTGTGELLRATPEEHPDLFALGRVGLGALGILTTVTFRVEPLFVLEAEERPVSWAEGVDAFDDLVAENHHCDLYWFPHTDRMQVKTNNRLAVGVEEAHPLPRWRHWLDDHLLANTAFGAMNRLANRVPAVVPRMNQLSARALSARTYSDVAHRVFTTERSVVFKEMEYALPRAAGMPALREVRRLVESSPWRIAFPVEIRSAPADDVALSTAYGRDSVYLAFHVHRDAPHEDYFGAVERILRGHGGRPHWGKLHTCTADDLAGAYPRFADFLALRDRLDPDRLFANPYLRRVLGP